MIHQTEILNAGRLALRSLRSNTGGKIFGRTSRGDFLLIGEDEIVFLSFEPYRGPLTLNVHSGNELCRSINPGEKVKLVDDGIFFPDHNWILMYPGGDGWVSEVPTKAPDPHKKIILRFKTAAEQLLTIKPPSSISANLEDWLQLPARIPSVHRQFINLELIVGQSRSGDAQFLWDLLAPLVGLGEGLTPSGDDLIIGFLLTHARWGNHFGPGIDFEPLKSLLFNSLSRTTLVSRSLIKAAILGESDERLVDALDSTVCGEPELFDSVSRLATWGSHSGGDVLTGMVLYFLVTQPV